MHRSRLARVASDHLPVVARLGLATPRASHATAVTPAAGYLNLRVTAAPSAPAFTVVASAALGATRARRSRG